MGTAPVPRYVCRELKCHLRNSSADHYHQRISLLSLTKCDVQTHIIPLLLPSEILVTCVEAKIKHGKTDVFELCLLELISPPGSMFCQ